MKTRLIYAHMAVLALALSLMSACVGSPGKTDAYIFADENPPTVPMEAWLRTLEIVSDNLPLSSEYPIVSDSLVAIAFKYSIQLSTVKADQPYIVDLTIHERSYTADLSSLNSVMAVLNLSPSGCSDCAARVVYTESSTNSVVALYYVNMIGESVFATLSKAIADQLKELEAKATAAP
jgi:hypothetical protein